MHMYTDLQQKILSMFKNNKIDIARKFIDNGLKDNLKLYYYYIALSYCAEDDFPKAAKYFELSKEKGLDSYLLFYNLGVTQMELNNMEMALYYFKESIKLNKGYWKNYFNLGLIFEKLGDFKGAYRIVKSGLAISGLNPELKKLESRLSKYIIMN